LETLPLEVWTLSSLKEFVIESHYDILCPEIKQLTKLETLKIYGTVPLPKEIWQLPSLQTLAVHPASDPHSLPALPEVELLREIKSVKVNLIVRSYSNFFQNASNTTLLNLSRLGKLRNLEEFTIRFDHLPPNYFPDEMWLSLRQLRELHFHVCNGWEMLPSSIGKMEFLADFTISQCRDLQSIPSEIGCLSKLLRLQIRDCPSLRTLPPEIGSLNNLRRLEIRNCSSLRTLPPEILGLPQLQELRLAGGFSEFRIADILVDDEYCSIQDSLEIIDLGYNWLGEEGGDGLSQICNFLSGCSRLKHVLLYSNRITSFKPFVPNTTTSSTKPLPSRLEMLNLRCNPLEERPIEQDLEGILALLDTHFHLKDIGSARRHPKVDYLLDLNRCGRSLLLNGGGSGGDDDGDTATLPLSVWPTVLEGIASLLNMDDDQDDHDRSDDHEGSYDDGGDIGTRKKENVERIASVIYYFLRNGPAFAARGKISG
jgi:Leucine-rich repeat (LRR) protein